MQLSHFKIFSEVVKYGSITKAAQEAHLSQPAVSKVISRLEARVGCSLFNRTNNRLYLNEYGEIVLEAYSKINNILSDMQNTIHSYSTGQEGKVTVATTFPSSRNVWINECLKEYRNSHEKVLFNFIHLHRNQISAAIKNHEIDFALTDYTITDPDINWRELYRERLVLLLSNKSSFSRQSSVSLYDVRNEPFVSLASQHPLSSEYDDTISICQMAGFTPNIVFCGNIKDAVENEVAENRGMMLISEESCQMLIQDSSRPLYSRLSYSSVKEEFCYRYFGIASDTNYIMSPAVSDLYEFFINTCRFDNQLNKGE